MTATTAKGILPDSKGEGKRKQLSKVHEAKLVAALAKWRPSLSDEERQALKERLGRPKRHAGTRYRPVRNATGSPG